MPSSPYEVGDEVDLRVRVDGFCGLGEFRVSVVGEPGQYNCMTQSQLDAGKRIPRPIKVGDEVRTGTSIAGRVKKGTSIAGRVKAVEDGFAWVAWFVGWPAHSVVPVSDLVRVSP